MKKLISIIVPIYNEAAGLKIFLKKDLIPVLSSLPESVELILVDDGSTDDSLVVIKDLKTDFSLKVLALMRNFGKEIALTAGLREASGDAVIMIDADGQHPAEKIPDLLEKWRSGAKIVTAIRKENTTKHKLGSKFYYFLMHAAGNKNIVEGEMDFRLLDREVVNEFNRFTEHNRLTRGLINWLGFPQEYIKVKTKSRTSGKPTYNFRKLMALAGDSIISASRTPLVIFGYIGIFIMIPTFFLGLFQLVQEYLLGDPLHLEWHGSVAVSLLVAFLVGLVLISESMTALYVSQIHAEAKNRPLYIINREKSSGLKSKGEHAQK